MNNQLVCNCNDLDDDLIKDGWTCYQCYEKDRHLIREG